VLHRLPSFDAGLLGRAAQARRQHRRADEVTIAGMRQPDSEQLARERDLSSRPTGQLLLREPRPGSVLSVR
jgi:hypothetical protein